MISYACFQFEMILLSAVPAYAGRVWRSQRATDGYSGRSVFIVKMSRLFVVDRSGSGEVNYG
jgi:hypothetical protein